MPSESDFRNAEALIRRALTDVEAARQHLALAQQFEPVRGGRVASLVVSACETGLDNMAAIRQRMTWLAESCDRRALVCAEHEAALRRWHVRYDQWKASTVRYRLSLDDSSRTIRWPGPEPTRPRAPFDWVVPT